MGLGAAASGTDPTWDAALDLLDEGLARLSPARREAILRFHLQGRTQAEVAAELGCSEDAVKTRVHEGITALRAFFARRGLALSAAAIASGLSAEASAASADIPAACASAAIHPSTAASAAGLASGVATTMIVAKFAVISGILAIVLSAGVVATTAEPDPPPEAHLEVLDWLARCQEADGGWPADAGMSRTMVSAKASSCFLSYGYDFSVPNRYQACVDKAVVWLATPARDEPVQDLIWRCSALAKACAMTGDQALMVTTSRLTAALLARRTGQGWADPAKPGAIDTRMTWLAVMALREAASAEIAVGEGLREAKSWFAITAVRRHHPFPARVLADGSVEGMADAEAFAAAVLLGFRRGDQILDEIAGRVAGSPLPEDALARLGAVMGLRFYGDDEGFMRILRLGREVARSERECTPGSVGRTMDAELIRNQLYAYLLVRHAQELERSKAAPDPGRPPEF